MECGLPSRDVHSCILHTGQRHQVVLHGLHLEGMAVGRRSCLAGRARLHAHRTREIARRNRKEKGCDPPAMTYHRGTEPWSNPASLQQHLPARLPLETHCTLRSGLSGSIGIPKSCLLYQIPAFARKHLPGVRKKVRLFEFSMVEERSQQQP